MNNSRHLFFLMNHVFVGFTIAVAYGAISGLIVWQLDGIQAFSDYSFAFFRSFNGAIVGGLIISTAILVYRSQCWVPDLIDETFVNHDLSLTEYTEQKRRFLSAGRSISFATTFIVVGFGLFTLAEFPFDGFANYALMAFACIQYGLGVYVGRKLFYIAQMLHAIEGLDVKQDIFTDDRLGTISTYVNSLSTLTVIFVFAHVHSFYHAPFEYGSVLGDTVRTAMLLPAVLAIPVVVIFNFYPRTVLRNLYSRSIAAKTEEIKKGLVDANISEFERLTYLIEYDKMSKDELKYRLRMTLSDLPIAITIILMIASVIF